MGEITLTDIERLGALDEADRTFQMTEEAFRTFYELTARPVRVYLARLTGDDRLADDLLQETYYRFLRANVKFETDDQAVHRSAVGGAAGSAGCRRRRAKCGANGAPARLASRHAAVEAAGTQPALACLRARLVA
jgi:hypothetical protein